MAYCAAVAGIMTIDAARIVLAPSPTFLHRALFSSLAQWAMVIIVTRGIARYQATGRLARPLARAASTSRHSLMPRPGGRG